MLTSCFSCSGVQLGYTVIFGWYAAFLFIRTGLTNSFVSLRTENHAFVVSSYVVDLLLLFLELLFQLYMLTFLVLSKKAALFVIDPSSCLIIY